MLHKLFIQNYALIDTVEIDFSKQLNIITGETGAGKSIILGALSLILGQRQEQTSFFNPKKKCIVEGYFQIQNYQLKNLFEAFELDYEENTIIRREISPEGRSRAFVNDSPVSLSILKNLTESLISIHSQHGILELGRQNFQLSVLDAVAKQQQDVKSFGKNFKTYLQKLKQYEQLHEEVHRQKAELDYLQFQYAELANASLKEGELESLEIELKTLTHAEEIQRTLHAIHYQIYESEHAQLSQLSTQLQQIQLVEKFHPDLEEIGKRFKSVHIELKDIAAELENLQSEIVTDEQRLQEVQERLDRLYTLLHKHKVTQVQDLIALQSQLEQNISTIEGSDEQLLQLQKEISTDKQALLKYAKSLSDKRKEHTNVIEKSILRSLSLLGMEKAAFKIQIEELEELNSTGINQVSFLFSANLGQTAAPIAKIASGGELSRIMLSIKSLIAQQTALPTIIFDEIDTGVSGEVALQMGAILNQLSQHMQVVAITHLPQIASKGNYHLFVYKESTNDTFTKTQLKVLNHTQRLEVIAEMLSGKKPTKAAYENAQTLLEQINT